MKEMNKTMSSFVPAAVLRRIPVQMEGELLAGSVVEKMKVESAGQEFENFSYGDAAFNHDWGE